MALKISSKSKILWLGDSHKVFLKPLKNFSSRMYFRTVNLGQKEISLIFLLREIIVHCLRVLIIQSFMKS